MKQQSTAVFCFLLLLLCGPGLTAAFAGRVSGTVKTESGNGLPFASVLVKGSSKGTTTNERGEYFLQLDPGTYTLVCQYVGYRRAEKSITVTPDPLRVDFVLQLQQTAMKEVIVRSGGEDPAYAIIRKAIGRRKAHLQPLDSFTCEAYIKTLVKLRKLPKKILGKQIAADDRKEMGVDSTGKGIIYLSESITRIAFRKPDQVKLEVRSGRESGSSGYGFNFPTFINFYENNVNVFASQFSPRGYISPIADNALHFYRYKYLGSFYEEGREINQIKVIPKRTYEPLFAGTINITEGDWHIHSLELLLTKESQLQLMDTLRIKQIQAPVAGDVWRTRNQVIYFTFNQFGIDATGNFINIYNQYDLSPVFPKNYFNKVIMRYDTAVNKKTMQYWDSIRPMPLQPEELRDYQAKDSAYAYRRDSGFTRQAVDSLRRRQGRVTVPGVAWSGFTRSDYNPKGALEYTWQPLLPQLQYNTVEGLAMNMEAVVKKQWKRSRRVVSFTPHVRYGFSNQHFNAWGTLLLRRLAQDAGDFPSGNSSWLLSGGKRISQFNRDNPISAFSNEVHTLLNRDNYMKLYENYYAQLLYTHRLDNDLRVSGELLYEDRIPVNNSTDYSFGKRSKSFTPNYPYEKIAQQFPRHQAILLGFTLQYQPGQRYIQFPHSRLAIGSKWPTFILYYQKGIAGIAGSDVNFDKWKFTVSDEVNFKLPGQLYYRFSTGGFINTRSVYIQDYQHFNGNQTAFASTYLNSFQLAPYYANSTTAKFYVEGHLEHHFNGFLTNKIPLFKRLNWNLVAGSNAFVVNGNNNYVEAFAGIENIFKVVRVDLIAAYLNGTQGQVGVRVGMGGLLGNVFRRR